MPSKDQVQRLLWHYQNLYDNTDLLVSYCAQQHVSLRDGFADVCDALEVLRKQLEAAEVR